MSLCDPLPHGLLKELGKLAELRERGLILDRHFETIKTHVKAGNSVAKDENPPFLSTLREQEPPISGEEWDNEIRTWQNKNWCSGWSSQ